MAEDRVLATLHRLRRFELRQAERELAAKRAAAQHAASTAAAAAAALEAEREVPGARLADYAVWLGQGLTQRDARAADLAAAEAAVDLARRAVTDAHAAEELTATLLAAHRAEERRVSARRAQVEQNEVAARIRRNAVEG
jgi:subtilase-type serine protease